MKLQYDGNPIPLPQWFIHGHNAKLTRFSMLENFPNYMKNVVEEHPYTILKELQKRQHFKRRGRPSFSPEIIRYALLLRYTSKQAYKLLLEKFPLPSFSLLEKIQSGGVESISAAKSLREKGHLSQDCILMVDEMYIQKGTQFHSGEYIGANVDDQLYKGIIVFMITGLKKTIPFVVKACPEVKVNGEWLSHEILKCISQVVNAGFFIRAVVADNHSANVNAFNILLDKFEGDKKYYITIPNSPKNIFLFFDSVHLLKNIRNSLLNRKKFVFPCFRFEISNIHISSENGYIAWSDIHKIYDKDSILDAKLRKASKLTFKALYPSDNKQNVNLAIAIFHETTIAACESYFADRTDMSNFLKLILCWWTIANSNKKYTPNFLNNAVNLYDGKIDFFKKLSDWVESWAQISDFCLTKQTSKAFVVTLRAQAMLMQELLGEGYEYIFTRRLQSDPLENRFSQYRQMSGGRFLVSLREVLSSERILTCRSLLKENINFWEEGLKPVLKNDHSILLDILAQHESEIQELSLSPDSKEVAYTISGYISKKLIKRFQCEMCSLAMVGNDRDNAIEKQYFDLLSRGGLTIPSNQMAEFVGTCFAILDYADKFIAKHNQSTIRESAEIILETYSPKYIFTCEQHSEKGLKFASKIVVNIFYNNKQRLASDEIRKQAVNYFKKRQRSKEN